MPRYKLFIEYDGSRYAGWQVQRNARTVQGELLEAAYKIFETRDLELYGSGRTDAGVHAREQVAHLEVADIRLKPDQIKIRLNDNLAHDINILAVETASPHFHARHDAKSRSYVYQISKRRDAFGKKYVWWVRDPLDLARMRLAANTLLGFHDFRSFGDVEKSDQSTTVDLTSLNITEDADRIYIQVSASHFLWKMVRRIVGVLVAVGRGNLALEDVEIFLDVPSREPAKFTAPPSGLFLDKIAY